MTLVSSAGMEWKRRRELGNGVRLKILSPGPRADAPPAIWTRSFLHALLITAHLFSTLATNPPILMDNSWGHLSLISEDVFAGALAEQPALRDELVPLDESFWVNVTYTALTHMRQSRKRTPHPDDSLAHPLQYPDGLQDLPNDPAPPRNGPPRHLANRDSHLRRVVGSSAAGIAPYLRELLRPEYERILDGPPHTSLAHGIWLCPHPDCEHYVSLGGLSPHAVAVVRAYIPGALGDLAAHLDPLRIETGPHGNLTVANPAYAELVVDLVALEHLEAAHLGREAGLRCVVYGQDRAHRLNYEWQQVDIGTVLTSRTAVGIAARAYEESQRLDVQASISILARRWAVRAENAAYVTARDDRDGAHKRAHESAQSAGLREIRLSDPRGQSLWRQAKDVHRVMYEAAVRGAGRLAEQERLLAEAGDTMEYWNAGGGRARLQRRPNDPTLHALP
ncbi:unnamed protein product [Peniophora sp. CBMAI 1063]|nr:unnamed protein product [Peniophora sp. CBMAI 1063]